MDSKCVVNMYHTKMIQTLEDPPFHLSYNTISNEDLDNMRNCVPYFLNILRTQGEIKEIEHDSKNIPKLPDCDYDIRDGLVLWRQRAVVITNDETVLRFVNYETMRLLKLDKPLQKSLSVVEKHNKQEQRKVNKVISQTQRLMFTEEEKAKQKADKELQKQINLLAKQSKLER